jgi:hypothetical protein
VVRMITRRQEALCRNVAGAMQRSRV